jgi:hypothetical protein
MTSDGYDMSSASLVEALGAADPETAHRPYVASPALQVRHLTELLAQIHGFLAKIGLPQRVGLGDLVQCFELHRSNPGFGKQFTTPGNLTVWLFMLVRTLRPKVAVESGVLRGSSLFMQRVASPDHTQYAFDLDFSNLAFRADSIIYRELDWGTDDVRAEGPDDFAYFNDHINNCLRLRQCWERGFRHVVVDDTPDLGEIQAYRFPALPSVSMIANGKFQDGDTLEWTWNGQRLRYTFRTEHTHGARELIEHCHPIPHIRLWTGLPDSNAYYVKLKERP